MWENILEKGLCERATLNMPFSNICTENMKETVQRSVFRMSNRRRRKQAVLHTVLIPTKTSSVPKSISRPIDCVEQGGGGDQAICGRVPAHSTTTHSTWHNAFFSSILSLLKLDRVSFTHFNAHIVSVHSIA